MRKSRIDAKKGRPSRNFINMDFSGHRIPRDTFEVNDDFSCSMVITSGNGILSEKTQKIIEEEFEQYGFYFVKKWEIESWGSTITLFEFHCDSVL